MRWLACATVLIALAPARGVRRVVSVLTGARVLIALAPARGVRRVVSVVTVASALIALAPARGVRRVVSVLTGASVLLATARVRAIPRALPCLLAAIVMVAAPHAHAQPKPADAHAIEKFLAQGQQLFDEQEYAAAVQTLAPVTRDARATRAQRLRALELMALAHFIRGDQGAARATFERILDIDPGYQLRDTSGSPKIRAFFDALKKQLIPGYDPNAGADLEHAAPTAGTAARPIELEVRALRGAERVFELVIATRRRGELTYQLAGALPRGDRKWRARVTPPPSAKPYVLEYYVEARDAGGAAIARIAAPDAPLEIALNAGGSEGKRPWYGRWYVIGGATVVAAGLTGLAVAASRGPDPGTLPPGSVTVSP